MRKGFVLLTCLLLLTSFTFAQGTGESPTNAADKAYTIKIGHCFTAESPRNIGLLEFKSYVEKTSNGKLKVELYPNSVLGKEEDMQESMKMGNLEGFVGGPFDSETQKLNLILMPFFFKDDAALMRVSHSTIGQAIRDDAQKNGIKILAFGNGGSRQITNNVRPVKSPADMKGLKLRTPSMESIIECMKALGANPVTIPYADTYMALKTGVADGQENPLANIGDMKFYEVQKYMTYINYQFHPEVLCMNLKFYNSLPEDLRKICDDGAWKFVDKLNTVRRNMDKDYYAMIEKGGCQIYTPTDAELAVFKKACEPVYQHFINKGTFTREELNAVDKAAQGN